MSKIEKVEIGILESMYLKDALKEFKQSSTVFVIPINAVEHLVSISEEEIFADSTVMQYVIRVLNEFTIPAIAEIKKLSLQELDLPTRVYNALKKSGVTTEYLIEALQMDRPDMFLSMRNMGPIAIGHVVLALYNYGLPPSVFNPVYDVALVEVVEVRELLEKGLPEERVSAALEILNREKSKNQPTQKRKNEELDDDLEIEKPKRKPEQKGQAPPRSKSLWDWFEGLFSPEDEE